VTTTRRWVLRGIQLALLIAVAYYVYAAVRHDLQGLVWADFARWRPAAGPLLLSLVLLLGIQIAHAFLWRRILADLRVGRPSARLAMRIYFVSSLGRYLPGKVWQLAGVAALSAKEGIPAAPAAACSLIGQFGFLTTGVLLLAAVVPGAGRGPAAVLAAIALCAAGVGTWILVATPAGHRLRAWIAARLGRRLGPRVAATFELADHVRPRDAAVWFAAYGATWVVLGIAFSIFVTAFVPAAAAESRHLAATVAVSYLAGLLLFTPAGIGVRELAMVGMLTDALIPAGAAALIAASSRLWFTVAELLPLLLIPLFPDGRVPVTAAGEEGG
jgi:glycosyltransferase 2 family protein